LQPTILMVLDRDRQCLGNCCHSANYTKTPPSNDSRRSSQSHRGKREPSDSLAFRTLAKSEESVILKDDAGGRASGRAGFWPPSGPQVVCSRYR
jgi:hypothetical protein